MKSLKNKILNMSQKTKLLLMVVYLLAAWLLFSQSGFLPRFASITVNPENQHFTHIYNRLGYSETYLRHHIDDKTVEKGAINKLGILKNGNLGGGVYYSEKNNQYYVCDRKTKTIYTVDKSEHRKPLLDDYYYTSTFIRYGNYIIFLYNNNRYTVTLINSWSKIRSITESAFSSSNYKIITEILDTNEREKISLSELATIMTAVSDGFLDYWCPEEQTALFQTCDENGNRTVFTYTIGDEKEKLIGNYPSQANESWYPIGLCRYLIWEQGDGSDRMYTYDCKTNKKDKITDVPVMMSDIRYRVKESGEIAFAGIVKYKTGKSDVWFYDGDTKESLSIHLRALYDEYCFYLGADGVMVYTIIPDKEDSCTIYHTPVFDVVKEN